MKISGIWVGDYQIKRLDGSTQSDPFTFSMAIERDWLGRIHGPVTTDDSPGIPAGGGISGAARWGRINFTWQPDNPYYFDEYGFQPLNAPGQDGTTMPIEFSGKIAGPGESAAGAWQITTWWMERETTRKIKVILLQGSWRMQKRTPED
jgi:hypothetical protein